MSDDNDAGKDTPQPPESVASNSGADAQNDDASERAPEKRHDALEEEEHDDRVGDTSSEGNKPDSSMSGQESTPGASKARDDGGTQGKRGKIGRFFARFGLTGPTLRRTLLALVAAVIVVMGLLALVWSREPAHFDVKERARQMAQASGMDPQGELPGGYVTIATLVRLGQTLLDKGGGYLSNDIMPPSVLMDDMPAWENGVLIQIRTCLRTLVLSAVSDQGGNIRDPDIDAALKAFETNGGSWWFPSAETSYREGLAHLNHYLDRLAQGGSMGARFNARPDVLVLWLNQVEDSLSNLSRELGASVGAEKRADAEPGDRPQPGADSGTGNTPRRTPWIRIDNVFYRARGTGWALTHLMAAVAVDFEAPLAKTHGSDIVRRIILDLEGTQKPISSPMVLNGAEYGVFANHSLVMSAYLSRAETGLIDLRSRLE